MMRARTKRGFTLVEAVIAMLLTSILLVVAMQAAAASGKAFDKSSTRVIGRKLASGLLDDILALSYQEPGGGTILFGLEAGESTTNKTGWDDVDDFNGWSESPPQERDGSVMTDLTGWKRTVLVERSSSADGSTVVSSESGLKRITVTVSKNGLVVATRVAFKSSAP